MNDQRGLVGRAAYLMRGTKGKEGGMEKGIIKTDFRSPEQASIIIITIILQFPCGT